MLQHKKFHFPRMNLSEKQLTEYAGTYVQKTNDTLRLVVQDGKLVVKDQPGIELVPTASNSFFVMMNDVETEVKFKRDIRRKIDKLLVIDDNLVEFKKVE
jgi:hypothetical protein